MVSDKQVAETQVLLCLAREFPDASVRELLEALEYAREQTDPSQTWALQSVAHDWLDDPMFRPA